VDEEELKGFYVLPKRWIVERTYRWLNRCRRLVKDYENLTRSHAAFIILAMTRLMLRRIVRHAGATKNARTNDAALEGRGR
jgi:transposase